MNNNLTSHEADLIFEAVWNHSPPEVKETLNKLIRDRISETIKETLKSSYSPLSKAIESFAVKIINEQLEANSEEFKTEILRHLQLNMESLKQRAVKEAYEKVIEGFAQTIRGERR